MSHSESSLKLPMVNNEQMGAWLTGHSCQPVPSPSSYVVIGLLFFCPRISCPYSIVSSVTNWRFCGVLSNYHFGPGEAGKSIDELLILRCIYCSEHVSSTCWPCSWWRRRFVFRAFFPSIYTVLIPHFFLISSLPIIERDKERDRRLLLRRF